MRFIKLLLIIPLAALLNGCFNAAVSSAEAVYNRTSLTKCLSDQYISWRSERAIYIDTKRFNDSHVIISVFNGVILLTGQATSAFEKIAIERKIKNIIHPRDLYNFILVGRPITTLTHMSDTWITAKVKSQLLAELDIDPSQIKVVTEAGTVYLMGILLQQQADIAAQIARTTSGVQNVVKIFSYVKISKKAEN